MVLAFSLDLMLGTVVVYVHHLNARVYRYSIRHCVRFVVVYVGIFHCGCVSIFHQHLCALFQHTCTHHSWALVYYKWICMYTNYMYGSEVAYETRAFQQIAWKPVLFHQILWILCNIAKCTYISRFFLPFHALYTTSIRNVINNYLTLGF